MPTTIEVQARIAFHFQWTTATVPDLQRPEVRRDRPAQPEEEETDEHWLRDVDGRTEGGRTLLMGLLTGVGLLALLLLSLMSYLCWRYWKAESGASVPRATAPTATL